MAHIIGRPIRVITTDQKTPTESHVLEAHHLTKRRPSEWPAWITIVLHDEWHYDSTEALSDDVQISERT